MVPAYSTLLMCTKMCMFALDPVLCSKRIKKDQNVLLKLCKYASLLSFIWFAACELVALTSKKIDTVIMIFSSFPIRHLYCT